MKKQLFSKLFSMIFILLSLMTITVFAATPISQDGLEAYLTSSKTQYSTNESIDLNLTIKNNNPYTVDGITTAIILPDGIHAQTGNLTQNEFSLASGENKQNISTVMKMVASPSENDKNDKEELPITNPNKTENLQTNKIPQTEDQANLMFWLVLMIASFGALVIITVRKKRLKFKHILSLFLCVVILRTVSVSISANANSAIKSFTVTQNLTVDGTNVTLTAVISYKHIADNLVTVNNGTGSGTYAKGDTVSISADTAPKGKHFTGWTVKNGDITLANENKETTTFIMPDTAVEVTANYMANSYTITATSSENGSITPNDVTTVSYGESKTYKIKPNDGYYIADVFVDNVSQGAIETYTFNNITSNHTISVVFKNNINTEILEPFTSGFIRKPLQYYTAYYDVDYNIDKMYFKFNDGAWTELINDQNGSFTNNACMIQLPYPLENSSPVVHLKAVYKEKVVKIPGTPTLTLEGYKIKATLNGEVEYFTPSATPPTALVSINQKETLPNYKKFTRKNDGGEVEEFYLALRPKSTSKFTVDGLSPTDFNKAFQVSQDRNIRYYYRLHSYYAKNNDPSAIKFVDTTPKDSPNYEQWRTALADAIKTFNDGLLNLGFHIEEVEKEKSNNSISYGEIRDDFAGLTTYSSKTNTFLIQVSSSPGLIDTYNALKAVILHEMGHLIGFNDSAYAEHDSVYSYARNKEKVTYFQPNDIATLKLWLSKP